MNTIFSFAIGCGNKNSQGDWLDVFYPAPQLGVSDAVLELLKSTLNYSGGNQTIEFSNTKAQTLALRLFEQGESKLATLVEKLSYSQQSLVAVILAEDSKTIAVPEIYLKLHLLSHRLVKPHQINVSGIIDHLPVVAWTNQGAIDVEDFAERQLQARLENRVINVQSLDRLPPMTHYVVPTEVSIADTARVYLGAYLGKGTVVMQEGFVDFNAGCEENSTIMGSISTGFLLGKNSELAVGSATVSRALKETRQQFTLGDNCFIGANATLGMNLGNNCHVEEGLYLSSDTMVYYQSKKTNAAEFAGKNQLRFSYDEGLQSIAVEDAC